MDITDALFDPIERKFEDLGIMKLIDLSINFRNKLCSGITFQTDSGRLFFTSADGGSVCKITNVSGLQTTFFVENVVECYSDVFVLDNDIVITRIALINALGYSVLIDFEADYPVKLFEVITC